MERKFLIKNSKVTFVKTQGTSGNEINFQCWGQTLNAIPL